jgi:AcrR family transcriptional regulator
MIGTEIAIAVAGRCQSNYMSIVTERYRRSFMTIRGRPRSFDRDAALAAATELFWRKGFTATSMADLCEAMGIGSPSLYAAFGSKEALYAEALRHYGMTTGPLIWAPLEESETARGAIEGFLMASAATLPASSGKPGGCMVTLSTVREEGCGQLGRLAAEGRAEGLARIERRLARAVEDGELPAETDIPVMARFYLSVQQGMSIQARDGATRQELEAVARVAMTTWAAFTHARKRPRRDRNRSLEPSSEG